MLELIYIWQLVGSGSLKIINKFKQQDRAGKLQFLVVLAILLTAFFVALTLRHKQEDLTNQGSVANTIPVSVQEIKPETLSIVKELTGNVKAQAYINVTPEVSGRVVWVSPQLLAGGTFSAKEPLFKIEKTNYQAAVDQAEASSRQFETELMLAKAEADSAVAEWKSLRPDEKVPALVARVPQLEQAKARKKSAAAALEAAKADLRRAEFTMPSAGKVVDVNIQLGSYVRAGQDYGRLYTTSSVEIEVPIVENDLRFFPVGGTKVKILTQNSEDSSAERGESRELETYPASLARVSSVLDSNTRFAKLYIKPEIPPAQPDSTRADLNEKSLQPGLFVRVLLEGLSFDNVWKVPVKSLRDGESIWIVEDGKLKKYMPEIYSIQNEFAMIKGEPRSVSLVTSILPGVKDGMAVEVVN